MEKELLLKDECFAIVGAAIEVHRELGCGFLEAVYQEAIEIELKQRSIDFDSQPSLRIHYKGELLKKEYVPDVICFGTIIVELKALDQLTGKERSQILNYLKVSQMKLGILINFGSSGKLEWERFVH
ncbi:MAG: GxxExxY protein [Verrucomicrobiota bacterium]